MSKEHNPGDQAAEVSALRSQLAESQKQVAESREQMAEMNRKLDALVGQRHFQGDQQVVNVNLPNGLKESQKRFEMLSAQSDARREEAEARLREGPNLYRICIRDAQNLKRVELLEKGRQGNPVHPSEWNFNPFNPWRVVGGRDESEARAKYNAHFGIRGISDGADYVIYEVDEQGQPLVPAGA